MTVTLLSLCIILATMTILNPRTEGVKSYTVKKVNGNIDLTGKGSDPRWENAGAVTDFHYPWEKDNPPPGAFRALHNDEWFYGLFHVQDKDVYVSAEKDDKAGVAASSRAEIFFRIDETLNPYYCLELDPAGRVLDYKATYHRKFDRSWSWPAGHLVIRTHQSADGYTVEFAISKASLRDLGLLKGNTLQAGLFRAECFPNEGRAPDFKWISWMKPASATPDFHIPSTFGVLTLEE